MNVTMSLLHPVHKRRRMNSLEILNFFDGISLSSMNNLRKMKTPFWSHLRYATETRVRVTHFHFPTSDDPFQYSETSRHKATTSVWCVHSDNHFQYMLQYIILFIYKYLNISYSYMFLIFQDDVTIYIAYKHAIQHK